jgi:hypothetical protein
VEGEEVDADVAAADRVIPDGLPGRAVGSLVNMTWQCPACDTQIRHSEIERAPRPRIPYRCHICRLELMLDPKTNRLIAVPLDFEDAAVIGRRPSR